MDTAGDIHEKRLFALVIPYAHLLYAKYLLLIGKPELGWAWPTKPWALRRGQRRGGEKTSGFTVVPGPDRKADDK